MTEWKWEDAARKPPLPSVERRQEKIPLGPAIYLKDDQQHSHTRTPAETLGISSGNCASTVAPHSHDTREPLRQPKAPDSEFHASVVRDNPRSFSPESRGFLPPCESASVGPNLLYTAPEPAPVIAQARWAAGAAVGQPSFETPCPERRGLVERRGGAILHFCVECGRWGTYGYAAIGTKPGRWYCRMHRPDE
jgi:hypothetical protein